MANRPIAKVRKENKKKSSGSSYSSAPLGSAQRSAELLAAARKMLGSSGTTTPAPAPVGLAAPATGTYGTAEYQAGSSGTPYGASGRGEYLDNPEYAKEQEALIASGAPMSTGSDYPTYSAPKLDKKSAAGFLKDFGLTGMGYEKDFIGLTDTQAQKKAAEIQREKMGQTSALTSYTYNPKSISGFRDTFKDLNLRVKESSNDPFESRESKTQTKDALIKSFNSTFAKNFASLDEFNAASQDPEMQKLLKEYEKLGGSKNDIASNITKTGLNVVSETPNRDGTYTVTYSDGTQDVRRYSMNADGTYTSKGAQTIDQYLGAMSSPDEQQARQELIPEYQIQQDKIAFEQSIPEQYKQYYFGTPEQEGFLAQQEELAKEKIKILEKAAKTEERNLKAQASLLVEKNNWEQQKDEAEIEKNRLSAKNYTTGLLAKLGALKTTGAAVEGLANLEQSYQKQAQETRMAYNFQNKDIEMKLNESLDEIDNTLADSVWKVKNDLSKSEEDVWKDIVKMQTDADRRTFDIIDKYAGEFRTTKEKYRKERIAAAKKYAAQFSSIIGADDLKGVMEGDVILKRDKKGKIVNKARVDIKGNVRSIESILEASKGKDKYVNSALYVDVFDSFINAGGTRDEFLKQFPPNRYINPEDPTLPSFLKFGSSARSEAPKEDEEEEDVYFTEGE